MTRSFQKGGAAWLQQLEEQFPPRPHAATKFVKSLTNWLLLPQPPLLILTWSYEFGGCEGTK
jgi:hypothetical protein